MSETIMNILEAGLVILASIFLVFMWIYNLVLTLHEMYPPKKTKEEPRYPMFDPRKY